MLIFQLLWTRVSHRTSASPWQEMLVMCLKSCPSAYEGKQTTVLSTAPNHQHILFFWVCPTQQCAGLLWPQPMAQSEIIINNNSSASSKKCQTVALWFLWQHSSESQHNQTTAQLPHGLSFRTHTGLGCKGPNWRNSILFCVWLLQWPVCVTIPLLMSSVLCLAKEKSEKHHGYKHVLSSQTRKSFPSLSFSLWLIYLLPLDTTYPWFCPQLIQSKLLCGFCYTSGILQINHCTEFVLRKHLFVFKSHTWLNVKDPALGFLPGWLGSSDCLLLYVWGGWRRQGIG